jgi:hypothetical protein
MSAAQKYRVHPTKLQRMFCRLGELRKIPEVGFLVYGR